MNKEDQHIKPFMQIIFGIGLLAIFYLMNEPIKTVEKFEGTNWYDPSDELFLQFVKWVSLVSSICLIVIGFSKIISKMQKNK